MDWGLALSPLTAYREIQIEFQFDGASSPSSTIHSILSSPKKRMKFILMNGQSEIKMYYNSICWNQRARAMKLNLMK